MLQIKTTSLQGTTANLTIINNDVVEEDILSLNLVFSRSATLPKYSDITQLVVKNSYGTLLLNYF